MIFHGNISLIGRIVNLPFIFERRQVDQCDIIAYPGCSGGGIFDTEKGDILGLVSFGSEPGLVAITPTRIIYEWAKSHDCLWAFDPEVPLPASIFSWRSDVLERLIKERNTLEIDKRWGVDESALPSAEIKIEEKDDRLGPGSGKFQRPRFLTPLGDNNE